MTTAIDLEAGLRRLGYESFRPGQREAIETLLEKGRLLLVAPTGGGKSLIYQLPASLLPGTSLVISPLVVADARPGAGARGARRGRHVPGGDPLGRGDAARVSPASRAGAFKLVYVAPERLAYPGFRALAVDLAPPLVAVDEAHCISEWGHDFRPDYLEIGALLAEMRPPRVLACTATATPVVRDEILVRLGLGADTPQMLRGFARPNLALRRPARRLRAGEGPPGGRFSSPRRSARPGPRGGPRSSTRRRAGSRKRRAPGSSRGVGARRGITRG